MSKYFSNKYVDTYLGKYLATYLAWPCTLHAPGWESRHSVRARATQTKAKAESRSSCEQTSYCLLPTSGPQPGEGGLACVAATARESVRKAGMPSCDKIDSPPPLKVALYGRPRG